MPERRHLGMGILAGLLALAGAPAAWAQGNTLAGFESRLQTGKPITVVTSAGQVMTGRLSTLSATSLALLVDGRLLTLAADDVTRVRQRQPDSLWNGVLIGAAAGAVYALSWFVRDPNECSGTPCGSEFVTSAGLGGLIGMGIDALIKRTVTIEVARAPQPTLTPAVSAGPGRASVGLRLRF